MHFQNNIAELFRIDNRFYIDKRNIERLTSCEIRKYSIECVKVGSIMRDLAYRGKGIVNLCDTYVFAYLNDKESGLQKYQEYCKICNVSFRNETEFNKLIYSLSVNDYDISKGAICIDQNNLILEGQHRACILLKKYGPHHKISVVKILYKKRFSPQHALKLFVANIKNKIYMLRNK